MRTTRIFTKIFLSNAVIGLFAVMMISFLFYFLIRNALLGRTVDQLASVNTLKEEQIDSYFNQHQKDLTFLFTHDFFLEHFDGIGPRGLTTSAFPAEVGAEIQSIRTIYDFEEIIVVNHAKEIVYSATGQEFGIPGVVESLSTEVDSFHWIDASVQAGTNKTILLYIIPLKPRGQSLGFIIVRENFSKVQRLLLENAGMGKTGESYLVGPDRKLRSASRFFPELPPLTIQVAEQPADADHIRTDYRGEKVISFSRRLTNESLEWEIVSEIDFKEAMEPVVRFRNYLVMVTIVVAVAIVLVSLAISNAISRPILHLRGVIMHLAKGILPDAPVRIVDHDEIGQITAAVNQLVSGLRQTTEFAYQIGRGNFDSAYTSLSEQDTLGLALIHMRNQLKNFNEREIKLLRDKTAALLEGQENERKRITQELHDGVGQLLTAIRLRIDIIPLDTQQKKELVELINDTINEVKRISYNVMPGSLVDFGLEAALKGLCDNTARYSPLRFDFRYIRESQHELGFDVTVAVFRIVQEGINNILKHASARHVDLHILDKEDEIYVLLKDDGRGFVENMRSTAGLGLRSMKERARLLGGTVDIHSEPEAGTIVEARIPLAAAGPTSVSG